MLSVKNKGQLSASPNQGISIAPSKAHGTSQKRGRKNVRTRRRGDEVQDSKHSLVGLPQTGPVH